MAEGERDKLISMTERQTYTDVAEIFFYLLLFFKFGFLQNAAKIAKKTRCGNGQRVPLQLRT